MSSASLAQALAQQSEDLSRDLDSFSDRAFELQRLAKALRERAGREYVDKGVQAETTAVGAPAYKLERAKRMAPFAFQPLDRKLNWRKLRALNVERVVREGDTRSLLELYGELAYANLDGESVYDMTEANLIKLVRVMQLMLQVQQHQVEQGMSAQQAMQEQQMATVGALHMLPGLDVGDVAQGLKLLQGDFYKVADADLDAMFAQVRTDERTAARDTLAANVDQTIQALDLQALEAGGGGAAGGSRVSVSSVAAVGSGAARSSSAVRPPRLRGDFSGPRGSLDP